MTELFFREASGYAGLRDAIRARVEQLSISRICLDEITGLPIGYCGKLLSQGKTKGRKQIGPLSLDLLLPATGLKLLLVDDRDALAKIEPKYVARDATQVRLGLSHWRNSTRRKSARVKKLAKAKSARAKSKPKAKARRAAPYLSNLLPHHASGRR